MLEMGEFASFGAATNEIILYILYVYSWMFINNVIQVLGRGGKVPNWLFNSVLGPGLCKGHGLSRGLVPGLCPGLGTSLGPCLSLV